MRDCATAHDNAVATPLQHEDFESEALVRAYIINLARSPERRRHMVQQLKKTDVDYDFVEAIDGRALDLNDQNLVSPTWMGKSPLWPAEPGAILSHLKAQKRILESDDDAGLVLEDDVILPADLKTLLEAASPHMVGAEAVLLQYFSFASARRGEVCQFSRPGSLSLTPSSLLAFPTHLSDMAGAGAYVITRDACERMAKTVLPIRVNLDNWEFFQKEGAFDRVRCVVPMPVRINSEFRTTIDHYEAQSLQTRLREAIIHVPVISHALSVRRKRIMDRATRWAFVDEEPGE